MGKNVRLAARLAVGLAGVALSTAGHAQSPLPPVPVPPANPITEAKRVLGKVLFHDEQLSTSNVVSCATCHVMSTGGTDPRLARNPGNDGVPSTAGIGDDKIASPGIVASDELNRFIADAVFGVNPQITDRAANSPINAAFAPALFWDGRATPQFVDPQTQQIVLPNNGALESQAVAPVLNETEMAHAGFTWAGVAERLERVRPLDLATNLPPDVAAALASQPSYPSLFAAAFGDGAITASRIAQAIATYQRTLISDRSRFDDFQAGNTAAMTPAEVRGFNAFTGLAVNCAACHVPPLFTGNGFRNIGVRPPAEDLGRQIVTGNPGDRGRFKVPGLRNVALKRSFMHNGQFTTLPQVLAFYAKAPGTVQFTDNLDPAAARINGQNLPPPVSQDIVAFLGALTDPRVQQQQFPFDRPTLFTERVAQRSQVLPGGETPGFGGVTPQILVPDPAMVGNIDHRVGLARALPGAIARFFVSSSQPVSGVVLQQRLVAEVTVGSDGVATAAMPMAGTEVFGGRTLYVQWTVTDPSAAGGQARSAAAALPVFCGRLGCPPAACYANCDGSTDGTVLSPADFTCFLSRYRGGDEYANCDGSAGTPGLTPADFTCFLVKFRAGCQ